MNVMRNFLGKTVSIIPNVYFQQKTKALSTNLGAVESKVFSRCMSVVDGSSFASDFNLNAQIDLSSFRSSMPILHYQDIEPYITEMREGRSSGLISPRLEVPFFAITSGTTGPPKYLPVTGLGIEALKSTWFQWGSSLFHKHSYLFGSLIANIVSDRDQFRTTLGVPCGDLSGLINYSQPRYVKKNYLIPEVINKISNQKKKYFMILRVLLNQSKLELISTATPATLMALARWGDEWKESLIASIFDGSLGGGFRWEKDELDLISMLGLKPNRSRARVLEKLALSSDKFLPSQYWPNKKVISTWMGGDFSHFRKSIGEAYGANVTVRDLGLVASEGAFTIPISDEFDAGILNASRYFLEFLPVGNSSVASNLLRSSELDVGGKYELVATTPSGLVRYAMGDVVECYSKVNCLPVLRFLSKVENICDLTGEKLSSFQVSTAISEFLKTSGLSFDFCTVAPNRGAKPFYALFLPHDTVSCGEKSQLSEVFDQILRSINFIYNEHRSVEKIASIEIREMPLSFFYDIRDRHLEKVEGSIEQYKFPCLLKDEIAL